MKDALDEASGLITCDVVGLHAESEKEEFGKIVNYY
jgi:hypothetical protein